jgi:hypothetical protein
VAEDMLSRCQGLDLSPALGKIKKESMFPEKTKTHLSLWYVNYHLKVCLKNTVTMATKDLPKTSWGSLNEWHCPSANLKMHITEFPYLESSSSPPLRNRPETDWKCDDKIRNLSDNLYK